MSLTTSSSKNILLLVNFILAILSLVLIGFGIFILASSSGNRIDHGENTAAGLMITVGVIIVIVAIYGSFAAMREAKSKLIIYFVSIITLILIKLIILSMASHNTRDGLSGSVQEGFEKLWEVERTSPGALAYYEDWLHCCGVNNTEDYHVIHHQIPKTCCKQNNCVVGNFYPIGCQEKFEEYLSETLLLFKTLCWILIILEIAGAILSWLLFHNLKNDQRRSNVRWI